MTAASGSRPLDLGEASIVLRAACEPWAFTQEPLLRTSQFCKEAEKRDIYHREEQLLELWRVGALAPFVEARSKRLNDPMPVTVHEPMPFGTNLADMRLARDTGRLADPQQRGFRPQLRFSRPPNVLRQRLWWNGLFYSRWQLPVS